MSETPQPPPSDMPPPPPPGDGAPGAASAAPQPVQPVDYATPGAYPGPYNGPPPTSDDRTMGVLAHILGIPAGFLGPLIIWLVKKDTSPFVADQAKEALNFQISVLILAIGSVALSCVGVGFVVMPVVVVLNIVFCILATVETNKGVAYRYPYTLRLVK